VVKLSSSLRGKVTAHRIAVSRSCVEAHIVYQRQDCFFL